MTSQSSQLAKSAPFSEPVWLWAWNGICAGYRSGDSLFASDGIELGRFIGTEVYSSEGVYLGELSTAYDGVRLTTSIYKKWRLREGFVPTVGRAYKRPQNRPEELPFCGHESFPSPESIRNRSAQLAS